MQKQMALCQVGGAVQCADEAGRGLSDQLESANWP
jgi:hypothetical protein